MVQRFDSDTEALRIRARANSEGALHSLEDWIISLTLPRQGMHALDLGCGTGKQVFSIAPHVLPGGRVLGVDVSEDAVTAVNHRAAAEGLDDVRAMVASLDECVERLADQRFDLILSTYAVYYARDVVGLLVSLRGLLAPGGQVLVVGPARGTNREMDDLLRGPPIARPAAVRPVTDFISSAEIDRVAQNFASVRIARLENVVTFADADQLLAWWRNHNSYREELDAALSREVRATFVKRGSFSLTKNVLAVQLHV